MSSHHKIRNKFETKHKGAIWSETPQFERNIQARKTQSELVDINYWKTNCVAEKTTKLCSFKYVYKQITIANNQTIVDLIQIKQI